jgi:signal transduction histidine kinase
MSELTQFLQANIILIYFLYGLAHFTIGVVVAIEATRSSQLRLMQALPYLAIFELMLGVNEWMTMISKISMQIPTLIQEPLWAPVARLLWFGASLFFLFYFGIYLLGLLFPENRHWLRTLPFVSMIICGAGIVQLRVFTNTMPLDAGVELGELWIGYSVGVPATITTCIALLAERRSLARRNMAEFGGYMVGAALALAWYCALDQIIGPETIFFPSSVLNQETFLRLTGIPVEVFRTLAITVFAFFIIRTMRVFEVEYARRLETANQARFSAQEQATRELSVMFETCRILGSTLDLDQLVNDAITKIVTRLEPMIAGMIYLYDASEHALVERANRKRDGHTFLSQAELECTRSAADEAFQVGNVAYKTEDQSKTSIIAVPLIAREQIVGVICLLHRAAFSNYAVIQTLARQLGIALENANLYVEVQQKEKLRGELLERAVTAQEEERKRIARELHDDTGQTLTALGAGLGGVEQIVMQNPQLAQTQIIELKNLTMRAIDNLRQYIYDLRPSVLDDMGLVPALRWYAQQYSERTKIHVDVQIFGVRRRLSPEVETVLFRIMQEGLNNIFRHSHATAANVQLEFTESHVVLTVQDNGRGFQVDAVMGKSTTRRAWGLLGMQERVALVGGKFRIESVIAQGTKFLVEIPI